MIGNKFMRDKPANPANRANRANREDRRLADSTIAGVSPATVPRARASAPLAKPTGYATIFVKDIPEPREYLTAADKPCYQSLMSAVAKKLGRPAIYSEQLAQAVLWQIASGVTLRSLTHEANGVNATTVLLWSQQNEEFARQLVRARELAAHMIADEGLAIIDDCSADTVDGIPNNAAVNRARARADYRKWLAAKWNAAAYADKQLHTGPGGQSPIQVQHTYRLDNLTPDELAEFQRLLHKCRAPTIEG
jgi:hypothetical protein